MTKQELAQIAERCEKATGGPWVWEDYRGADLPKLLGKDEYVMTFGTLGEDYALEGVEPSDNDAAFIAHAREDIPKLLAEIDRLNRKLLTIENKALGPINFGVDAVSIDLVYEIYLHAKREDSDDDENID